MFTFISADNRFHIWAATKGFLLSDENTKQLLSFKTLDDCVNWLYFMQNRTNIYNKLGDFRGTTLYQN